MDYILLATLIGSYLLLFVTYDIACQYHKNFLKHMRDFPLCMQLQSDTAANVRWAIPKKHWAVHGPNYAKFLLNFVRHCRQMYSKGIESSWSHMNGVALSTKEMAPAVWHENLDSHWNAWNHSKIIGFGMQQAL